MSGISNSIVGNNNRFGGRVVLGNQQPASIHTSYEISTDKDGELLFRVSGERVSASKLKVTFSFDDGKTVRTIPYLKGARLYIGVTSSPNADIRCESKSGDVYADIIGCDNASIKARSSTGDVYVNVAHTAEATIEHIQTTTGNVYCAEHEESSE